MVIVPITLCDLYNLKLNFLSITPYLINIVPNKEVIKVVTLINALHKNLVTYKMNNEFLLHSYQLEAYYTL